LGQEACNKLDRVECQNIETQLIELAVNYLLPARELTAFRALQLDEEHPTAWEEYKPVWYPGEPRHAQLPTEPVEGFYTLDERVFNYFFEVISHVQP
jgi:hypothetical protein